MFDSAERWRPLNVDSFFAESRFARQHHACRTAAGPCDRVVSDAHDLSGRRVLDIAGDPPGGAYFTPMTGFCLRPPPVLDCDTGDRSVIYYDVAGRRDRPVIDYWWFLRFNNVPFTFDCRVPKVCFDHEGDWEGVRVIPPRGRQPLEVHYDAHGRSESYLNIPPLVLDDHPVVYVALGTHAAYPGPCAKPGRLCRESGKKLPEGRYDGGAPWGRSADKACGDDCLRPLPSGSWATWPGLWGRRCKARSCHLEKGPESPALQDQRARICVSLRKELGTISRKTAVAWAVREKLFPSDECLD